MPRALLLAVVVVALGACTPKTDLGQVCTMTKPCTGGICPMAAADLANATTVDYMSLGSTECDDLVCVRTASEDPVPATPSGLCTRSCINDDDCMYDANGNKGTFKCDQLLLSATFLEALKENDPETFDRVFGSSVSARYCIRPRTK